MYFYRKIITNRFLYWKSFPYLIVKSFQCMFIVKSLLVHLYSKIRYSINIGRWKMDYKNKIFLTVIQSLLLQISRSAFLLQIFTNAICKVLDHCWWKCQASHVNYCTIGWGCRIYQWVSCSPVGWGCRIHRLHPYRGVRHHSYNKCPRYDTKQSDGEVLVMLKLWRMQSTSLLPSLPGSL